MDKVERLAPLVGRILLAQIFLASRLNKIGAWEQTAGYLASKSMPMVPIFLIPASLVFHNFWAYQGMERQVQMIMFMKNLAIMGGLALVIGLGAGPLSLDDRKKEGKP